MLREFLCLQSLLGRLLVVAPMLAIFLVPLGLGIKTLVPAFPWWALCVIPLGAMALILLYVGLSMLDLVPPHTTPWALTPTRLWLDRCCLDPSTPETIEAGVASFPRFLDSCDMMVAFVSPEYFRSLWCATAHGSLQRLDGSALRWHRADTYVPLRLQRA